jgi:ribosomal protein S18 acetylase RimI-like enzyme
MPTIRAATVADARGIADVDVETWQTAYAGILPDTVLTGISHRHRAMSWVRFATRRPGDVIVAVEQEKIVGFGSCGAQRDVELPYTGEIYTLYVAPDFQGKDVGRQLLVALFARLIRCGYYSSLIWVLRQNPSRFFYERLGGRHVSTRQIRMAGTPVDSIAYGWPDLAEAVHTRARARSRID